MARQVFSGLVISTGKMNKTVKVRVSHIKHNKLIRKDVIKYRDFMVHDELNKCVEGDIVRIQYVRPLSAKKRFAVAEIMANKGTEWLQYKEEAPQNVAREETAFLDKYIHDREVRTELQGRSPIVENLRSLSKAFQTVERTEEQEKHIEMMKEKYNITKWPPTHEILKLDIAALKDDLNKLHIAVEKKQISPEVEDLLETDPVKADEILGSLGKNITGMKRSIKKNILLKYFARNLQPDEAPIS